LLDIAIEIVEHDNIYFPNLYVNPAYKIIRHTQWRIRAWGCRTATIKIINNWRSIDGVNIR